MEKRKGLGASVAVRGVKLGCGTPTSYTGVWVLVLLNSASSPDSCCGIWDLNHQMKDLSLYLLIG